MRRDGSGTGGDDGGDGIQRCQEATALDGTADEAWPGACRGSQGARARAGGPGVAGAEASSAWKSLERRRGRWPVGAAGSWIGGKRTATPADSRLHSTGGRLQHLLPEAPASRERREASKRQCRERAFRTRHCTCVDDGFSSRVHQKYFAAAAFLPPQHVAHNHHSHVQVISGTRAPKEPSIIH